MVQHCFRPVAVGHDQGSGSCRTDGAGGAAGTLLRGKLVIGINLLALAICCLLLAVQCRIGCNVCSSTHASQSMLVWEQGLLLALYMSVAADSWMAWCTQPGVCTTMLLIQGIGEGVVLPSMNSLVSTYVPPAAKSRGLGMAFSGFHSGEQLTTSCTKSVARNCEPQVPMACAMLLSKRSIKCSGKLCKVRALQLQLS